VHGRATDRRYPLDLHASKQKVVRPLVAPGVEERHKLATDRIHTCEVRALAEVAAVAGYREVVNVISPAMLFGDNMLDVVRQAAVLLAQQAILTTVIRSSPDKVARRGIHR
jgi:hypothetical protein